MTALSGASPTRILIVDDSALYRQSIQNVLRELPMATVVGVARNGQEAMTKIEELTPDLVTLDFQMPDMNGIEVLKQLKRKRLTPGVVMVSSFTTQGAAVTTEALLEGAFDFILKPSSSDIAENRRLLLAGLEDKITTFRESRSKRRSPTTAENLDKKDAPTPESPCRAVIVGASTGGPEALKTLVAKLPATLAAPVLVAQHMPPKYTTSLADRLNRISDLSVSEAKDGDRATAGKILLAPGGCHMKLQTDGKGALVRITDDPAENGVRPSLDYLVRSAADALKGNLLAVVLTGMGRDGLQGCQRLKEKGGYVFAQSREDCTVYGMPKAVAEAGLADRVLSLARMPSAIVRHVKRSRRESVGEQS